VVLFSFLPLLILHLIWIPATFSGKISSITAQNLHENNLQFPQQEGKEEVRDPNEQQLQQQEDSSSPVPPTPPGDAPPGVSSVFSPLFIDRTNDQSSHSVSL
jgi:hypothetical protein